MSSRGETQREPIDFRVGYFRPREWAFWRALIMAFFLCAWLGHLLEIPYCFIMNSLFGIVESDYAVRTDPLFIPYYVYGFGAAGMTLVLEPLKDHVVERRKTLVGAIAETFVLAILLSAVLETVMGLIINQPLPDGTYPYWDNSRLPGNILGQGWIVNDFFIGLMGTVYIWGIFPIIWRWLDRLAAKPALRLPEKTAQQQGRALRLRSAVCRWLANRANWTFVLVACLFVLCVAFSSLRGNGVIPSWLFSFRIF